MKAKEIRQKSDKELTRLIAEKRETARTLRFAVSQNEVKNHRQLRQTKKEIARLATIITENKYLGRQQKKASTSKKALK